jgi:hypothetical protein
VEFKQLFSLDLNFNLWLWPRERLYLYTDTSFWGQKATPGITNPAQGQFDFSKREFDLNAGMAWNYWGPWEGRVFAYSFNNLNRGASQTVPTGFNDGVGLENRYYLSKTYADLGTSAYDVARASFLSLGYYPTKSMVDNQGNQFSPGPFARAYLTLDLWCDWCYLYSDLQLIADKTWRPTLLNVDSGLAMRPLNKLRRLEFRGGTLDSVDLQNNEKETSFYLSLRYIY